MVISRLCRTGPCPISANLRTCKIVIHGEAVVGPRRMQRCAVQHRVGEQTSNMMIEVGALGVGPQQILINPAGDGCILIRGAVAEFHLENRALVIVSYGGQRGGMYGYRIWRCG